MSAVQVVTIKSLTTLYKNGEPANAIELANVEEHQFDIVVGKGLYAIGDEAIYIQPDFSLPMKVEGEEPTPAIKLFLDFTEPLGNPKSSKLGKGARIRAVKFNFQLAGSSNPVYSVGIMMPITEVFAFMGVTEVPENADEWLGVTKYEEPEKAASGMKSGDLPSGMYKTDETNIKNLRVRYPIHLTGTVKADGSSITIYHQNDESEGICSRQFELKLNQETLSGYTHNGVAVRKHYIRETRESGWLHEGTQEFFPVDAPVPEDFVPVYKVFKDTWVEKGEPVLNRLRDYCKANDRQLALRGELCGTGMRGSGNKNNPHASLPQQILAYAIDDYSKGVTQILPLDEFYKITEAIGVNTCEKIVERVFNSFDELKEFANEYFATHMIEGIVFKDPTSQFSAKFMNDEYDAKK